MDGDRHQPTLQDITVAILTTPGPVATARSFKQTAAKRLRTLTNTEFVKAIDSLGFYGKKLEVRVPRSPAKVVVFCKKSPASLQDTWPTEALCSFEQYNTAFLRDHPAAITQNILTALAGQGHTP